MGFWLQLAWWAILLYLAYWIYTWVEQKLGFSHLLVMVVAGILIYYLVIENPVIAALGIFGWIILTGGVLMLFQLAPIAAIMYRKIF